MILSMIIINFRRLAQPCQTKQNRHLSAQFLSVTWYLIYNIEHLFFQPRQWSLCEAAYLGLYVKHGISSFEIGLGPNACNAMMSFTRKLSKSWIKPTSVENKAADSQLIFCHLIGRVKTSKDTRLSYISDYFWAKNIRIPHRYSEKIVYENYDIYHFKEQKQTLLCLTYFKLTVNLCVWF